MGPDAQHTPGCSCCNGPKPAVETLDELAFQRSACAAAQKGDCERLSFLLSRNRSIVHSDGVDGTLPEVLSDTPRFGGVELEGHSPFSTRRFLRIHTAALCLSRWASSSGEALARCRYPLFPTAYTFGLVQALRSDYFGFPKVLSQINKQKPGELQAFTGQLSRARRRSCTSCTCRLLGPASQGHMPSKEQTG